MAVSSLAAVPPYADVGVFAGRDGTIAHLASCEPELASRELLVITILRNSALGTHAGVKKFSLPQRKREPVIPPSFRLG